MKVIEGKTIEDYMNLYGNDYYRGNLWDFDMQDLEDAIEPNSNIVYWNIDGRYYETKEEL